MDNNISEIDDERFFFAKDGYKNPKSELDATIDAFFSDEKKDDNSSICRFPARYHWLKKQLDGYDFPHATCKEYDKVLDTIDPQSTTLVFPSAHINSPASMFGHTFLRINSSYHSRLLSYAINYAADANPDKTNAVLFAIKGLSGGYFGKYSLLPYYEKLKEYRDTEQRDIWEYNLNLTKEETLKMVNHIWELKDTYSDYYFFDENCSYNMLWLLEIARPSVNLRDKFFYQVSPPETIFEITKQNLVKSKEYRPSKRKVLLEYETLLNNEEISLVKNLTLLKNIDTIDTLLQNHLLSTEKKQYILESAIELSEYYFMQAKLPKEDYLQISHKLSKARATLTVGKELSIQKPVNPDQAHRQLSVSTGYKHTKNNDQITFGIRPTYHDITNNDDGFLAGTQIEFFSTNFTYDVETQNTKLDYLKLLTIRSLSAKTKFFDPLSWMTSWQFNRDSLDDELNFSAQIGAGKSFYLGDKSYAYTLADLYIYDTNYSNSAAGATLGAVFYTSKKTKLNIDSNYKIYNSGDTQKTLDITQSYFPTNNTDIKLNYKHIEKFKENQNNVTLSFHYFF